MKRKRVVILGATGSIGESALKVARDIPERMEIVGLAANSNAEKLGAIANETRAPFVCLVNETKIDILRRTLEYKPRIFSGDAAKRFRFDHTGASVKTSHLEHGTKDHNRFRDTI